MKYHILATAFLVTIIPSIACKSARSVGLDPRDFDTSADPRNDFYQFVNGGWMARTTIPGEHSAWGVFHELDERNQLILREIMESAAKSRSAPENSDLAKLGAFWETGMNEQAINAQGAKPLSRPLEMIRSVRDTRDLQSVVTQLQLETVFPMFAALVEQDFKDATRVIFNVFQGGMGLPDRDYYLKTDADSIKILTAYRAHIARSLVLAGVGAAKAERDAAGIVELETSLAKAAYSQVDMRDPQKIYHLMSVGELSALTPSWDWNRYFTDLGAANIKEVNVGMPEFIKNLGGMIDTTPLDTWKAYLTWHVVHSASTALSEAFVNENFEFYGKVLNGTKELRPRWKRMLDMTDGALGFALGHEYVKNNFSVNAKRRAQEMVRNLMDAFADRIKTRQWMSDATKKQALEKLAAITTKIGYPDQWRDYSKLKINRTASFFENVSAAAMFEYRRNLNKLGRPVDRTEWGMTPQTVNAYYNPSLNEIVFPAAILQAPFFDERQDDALNYGAMGAVIGHELTHGFDDQGSLFDGNGNMRMWWSDKDREEFERRAGIIEKQFSSFVVIDDLTVNGKLTLGENIADLGGLTISFEAYQRSLVGKPKPEPIDGFSGNQRFFISWGRGWRMMRRPESLKLLIATNPHSPERFRVIGPLQNMPQFAEAFGAREGDPMTVSAALRAEIW